MYYHPSALRTSTAAPLPALLRNGRTAGGAFAQAQPRQIWLVPVDGTPVSMLAVEHVIAHADSARIRVHLVNVQPPIMAGDVSVLASAKLVDHLRRSAGERAVRDAKRLLSRHRFEYTCEVVSGAPAETITRSAAERGCAKIVMSTRRIGPIARIMGRSVSSRVVRLSDVTVTIVKSGNTLRDRGARKEQRRYVESMPCVMAPAA